MFSLNNNVNAVPLVVIKTSMNEHLFLAFDYSEFLQSWRTKKPSLDYQNTGQRNWLKEKNLAKLVNIFNGRHTLLFLSTMTTNS